MDPKGPRPQPHLKLAPLLLANLNELDSATSASPTTIAEGTDERPHVGCLGVASQAGAQGCSPPGQLGPATGRDGDRIEVKARPVTPFGIIVSVEISVEMDKKGGADVARRGGDERLQYTGHHR